MNAGAAVGAGARPSCCSSTIALDANCGGGGSSSSTRHRSTTATGRGGASASGSGEELERRFAAALRSEFEHFSEQLIGRLVQEFRPHGSKGEDCPGKPHSFYLPPLPSPPGPHDPECHLPPASANAAVDHVAEHNAACGAGSNDAHLPVSVLVAPFMLGAGPQPHLPREQCVMRQNEDIARLVQPAQQPLKLCGEVTTNCQDSTSDGMMPGCDASPMVFPVTGCNGGELAVAEAEGEDLVFNEDAPSPERLQRQNQVERVAPRSYRSLELSSYMSAMMARVEAEKHPIVRAVKVSRTEVTKALAALTHDPLHIFVKLYRDPMKELGFFVSSKCFSAVQSSVIIANTIYMGFDAEILLDNAFRRLEGEPETHWPATPEDAFIAFFMLEITLRVLVDGLNFVLGEEKTWNLVDLFLVVSSVFDRLGGVGSNLSVWRVLRVFRLVRLLKILRYIPLLDSLRTMAFGIVSCVVPLWWALVVICIITFAFVVFLMGGIGAHLGTLALGTGMSNEHTVMLHEKWGSMYKAWRCLFESTTGGVDWVQVALPLKEIHEGYYLVIALYIVFMTLGVMNILTSFFVDGAVKQTEQDREEDFKREQAHRVELVDMIRRMFFILDADRSGTVSIAELNFLMEEQKLERMFHTIGVPVCEVQNIFNLIDYDGAGEVDIDDFIDGILRVRGEARALDVQVVLSQTKKIMHMIKVCSADIDALHICLGGPPPPVSRLKEFLFQSMGDGPSLTRPKAASASKPTSSAVLPPVALDDDNHDAAMLPCLGPNPRSAGVAHEFRVPFAWEDCSGKGGCAVGGEVSQTACHPVQTPGDGSSAVGDGRCAAASHSASEPTYKI
eukprot:NODE_1001_length_2657_cov_7.915810.p1 GENE.NODE_1001_length_2657_cov_7.915810~~NODE_1001_length_2657_cov_7.915810.p1  ORF type:complete len:843 (+),score=232.98 NODE_1001_length_2657_cov_7.915810:68-2596(+)